MLSSAEHLERYLAKTQEELVEIARDFQAGRRVKTHSLEVKGKRRKITSPEGEELKYLHRRILGLLSPALADLPISINGYIRGRSSVTNAKLHSGKFYIQKYDVQDFFDSVTFDSIEQGLRRLGVVNDVARLLADLVTVERKLPTGFSTSPAIANIACWRLDEALKRISVQHDLTMTRYADDIAFSSKGPFQIYDEVVDALLRSGFSLNASKFKTLKHGQPLYVSGLLMSEQDGPRLPRPFKKRMRQEMFYIQKFGLGAHSQRLHVHFDEVRWRLGGQLAYARSVEPEWVASLSVAYPVAAKAVARNRSQTSERKRTERLLRLCVRVKTRPEATPTLYVPTSTYDQRL